MAKVIETDVLIVGGGGAAARAAIEAHQAGARTTLAVKGDFGLTAIRGSGATGIGGGNIFWFRLAGKSEAENEIVFERMVQAGLGMADRKLIRRLITDLPQTATMLDKWGVMLRSTSGTFGTAESVRFVAPMPGLGTIIRGYSEISILERMMISDLLIQDGSCVGAIGVSEEDGEPVLIKASSTILATGGNAQLFTLNFHPSCVTGDGYAMGYDAGAELMNMEFEQIFTATAYPTVNDLPLELWECYPKILNVNGDEFIQNYLPQGVTLKECMDQKAKHGPYSTRDASKYLEISMTKEAKAGRANEHCAFYLEVPSPLERFITPELSEHSLEMYTYRGIDWTKKYVEIGVAHHCSNGGLRIDENGQTTIPGLYAAGETATGAYGADRLGGVMQAACQVFGARAGRFAAETAKSKGLPVLRNETGEDHLKRIADLKKSKGDQKPSQLLKLLKRTAWENLLAVRTKESLNQVLEDAGQISNELVPRLSIENTPELIAALELRNMLLVADIVAKAALMRTETRGSHYREDFPERDDSKWLQSIIVNKVAGKIQLTTVKLDEKWEERPIDIGGGEAWG